MRLLLFVLLLALTMPVPTFAGDCDAEETVLIRDTRSRHTSTRHRRPLTSWFLDTTSTRLIDARRGHRPYSTVHSNGRNIVPRQVRRSRGIMWPSRLDYTRPARTPNPRTGVTTFRGADREPDKEARTNRRRSGVTVVGGRRSNDDSRVSVYHGEPELPEHSGAVIVRKDGTVISVGG